MRLGRRQQRRYVLAISAASMTALIVPAQHSRATVPPEAIDAGELVVVNASNRSESLTQGDTNTVFSVRLPAGAECPGDSANDDWRVQSFIVPAGTDVSTLQYGATRPRGEYMYGLYTTEGAPYVQVLTAQNPAPGQPGQILDPPPLSFATFTPDLLPVGNYVIGMSCSYYERGERFWDAELVLTEAPEVEPGERNWQVVTAVPSGAGAHLTGTSDRGGGNWMLVAVAVGIGALVLIALGAALHRKRPQRTIAKEHLR